MTALFESISESWLKYWIQMKRKVEKKRFAFVNETKLNSRVVNNGMMKFTMRKSALNSLPHNLLKFNFFPWSFAFRFSRRSFLFFLSSWIIFTSRYLCKRLSWEFMEKKIFLWNFSPRRVMQQSTSRKHDPNHRKHEKNKQFLLFVNQL